MGPHFVYITYCRSQAPAEPEGVIYSDVVVTPAARAPNLPGRSYPGASQPSKQLSSVAKPPPQSYGNTALQGQSYENMGMDVRVCMCVRATHTRVCLPRRCRWRDVALSLLNRFVACRAHVYAHCACVRVCVCACVRVCVCACVRACV